MRGVFAGDVTQATVNAFVLIDFGDVMVIDVQIFPMRNFFNGFTNEIGRFLLPFFVHPIVQTFAHIFYNSETVCHGGGTNLNGCGA